jgi:Na+/proline symporter
MSAKVKAVDRTRRNRAVAFVVGAIAGGAGLSGTSAAMWYFAIGLNAVTSVAFLVVLMLGAFAVRTTRSQTLAFVWSALTWFLLVGAILVLGVEVATSGNREPPNLLAASPWLLLAWAGSCGTIALFLSTAAQRMIRDRQTGTPAGQHRPRGRP